ncbi:MAG: gamma-glutamyl-gamma-aminobutyrate hydrolase family protein [Bacilli bacterium]|nr:gamma-glutamyl-gamma-aminobutyrate hydrolase family protein [Bacilli bacterium]MDD3305253.1 gamma-glutamyl-gamma-aminobutyrate hydrolase family protein [Bacilli bacterium]MDD4053976.1 gamma-glutamyl-gamma-aminobutyrate hydrolase family protein [Bacilli bacterium]MDD4411442.1 gamma-glutamyl-gamma-aminobutyrate hydrolase family protein [Bacilli bacterium]
MTKPIIGIIGRRDKIVSTIDREGNIVLYDYMDALDKEECSYIGLITNSNYDYIDENILKMCDGILMTGGVEIKTYHIEIIKYAIAHNIPFFGICQGAQALALSTLTGAKLTPVNEENGEVIHAPELKGKEDLPKTVHKVYLDEGSLLYDLFGSIIDVNSNHHYLIPRVSEPMQVVGLALDNAIEAIEHKDKSVFAVGVQWHPENMESMQPLFKEFVNRAKIRKEVK